MSQLDETHRGICYQNVRQSASCEGRALRRGNEHTFLLKSVKNLSLRPLTEIFIRVICYFLWMDSLQGSRELEESTERKSRRRGLVEYEKNPFVPDALASTRTGTRRISPTGSKDRFMIVSDQGEVVAPAGFHEIVEVDKSQYLKLYVNGVKALQGLSSAGTKVFELVFTQVQERPGRDQVFITFPSIDQTVSPISRATFDRGMRELLEKKFLAMTPVPGKYYINVDYIFNGDRLAFIKEFRLRGVQRTTDRSDNAYREELEQRGQLRLVAPPSEE